MNVDGLILVGHAVGRDLHFGFDVRVGGGALNGIISHILVTCLNRVDLLTRLRELARMTLQVLSRHVHHRLRLMHYPLDHHSLLLDGSLRVMGALLLGVLLRLVLLRILSLRRVTSSKPFGIKFTSVIFQKHVIFVYFYLDVV